MDNKYDKWGHSELLSERKEGKKGNHFLIKRKSEEKTLAIHSSLC